jgi:hypothetical protein
VLFRMFLLLLLLLLLLQALHLIQQHLCRQRADTDV